MSSSARDRETPYDTGIAQAKSGGAKPRLPRRVRSESLLGDARELVIEHAGRDYRLRVTANGKLILTA